MKRIAFIPLDNRPVCYDLPKDIIDCCEDFEILLPPFEYIGALYTVSEYEKILNWFQGLKNIDYVVCALDTIAYGSLVASRRCELNISEIEERIGNFVNILKSKNAKTYAFSSIMRISNNNFNEEEKLYWDRYGKKIFDYSYNYHKSLVLADKNYDDKLSCISGVIPKEILGDYLKTRERNFNINMLYLKYAQEGVFDLIVFSKDDCAQYGLNVMEAQKLKQIITLKHVNALVKTGADEIPLSLLSRILSEDKNVKIYPLYTEPNSKNLISKYEDVSVDVCVKSQIEIAGCEVASNEESADLILYVNNFIGEQGELVMDVQTENFCGEIRGFEKQFFVADIRFANGADNKFIEKLFNRLKFDDNFYGFSGWNTSANSIGSAICAALCKYCSQKFNSDNFKKLQVIRFLDDWGYQANVRNLLRNNKDNLSNDNIYEYMQIYENKIKNIFNIKNFSVNYEFPWQRFFEIRVKIDSKS